MESLIIFLLGVIAGVFLKQIAKAFAYMRRAWDHALDRDIGLQKEEHRKLATRQSEKQDEEDSAAEQGGVR